MTTVHPAPSARARLDRASGRARRAVEAVVVAAIAVSWLLTGQDVGAASPSPSLPPAGDTRSALEGPGFVGSPELAILGVLAIGLTALVATLLYVRLTARRETRSR